MQRKQSYSKQKIIVFVSAIFIIAALIILLSSCNILQNIFGDGSNDTTPPIIISVSPKDGETNVPINTSIIVEFSETMNEADTQEAFTILPSVTGSFIWSNQSTVMSFKPDNYLETIETYTINISTEAKDVAGNTLESPYQWIFQTGSGANIDTTAPEEVSGFTATAGDGEVQLSWSNPSDADFAGVVLVYRTDRYPQAPDDGTEIYTGSGTSFVHTGLTNGTTYYYTIFAYDGVPNYSGGVQASATPSVETFKNKIIFSSNRDGNEELYIMISDGSNQTRLTNNSGSDRYPAVSPDGTKIAFSSDYEGDREVYVMDIDGTNIVNLTNNTIIDSFPAWSPDGSKIAFGSYISGYWQIFVMNSDGSNKTNISNNNNIDDMFPDWSPDGSNNIVFMSNRDGNWEIYIMNSDGTNQIRLTNNSADDQMPAWSPDGSKIVFNSNRSGNNEIYIMNPDGSNQISLTNNISTDSYPDYISDGSKIFFNSNRDGN